MQNPTDDDEAPIPTETTVSNKNNPSNITRIFEERHKAAERSLLWDLTVEDVNLMSSLQDEDIPARKRPRLEEILPATTDAATRKTASPDVLSDLPPLPDFVDVADNADTDIVDADSLESTRATPYWTSEEDVTLTSAVTNTSKKKCGKEYRIDWTAVVALVRGRTNMQCNSKWYHVLVSTVDPTTARRGKWTVDEDSKLKLAVLAHGGKIGSRSPRWFRVERKTSVTLDGMIPWSPISTQRRHV
jgi:hypothetical protein